MESFVPRANNIGNKLNDDNLMLLLVNRIRYVQKLIFWSGLIKLDEVSANNLVSYLKTKFARFMHKQAKASHDALAKHIFSYSFKIFNSSV